MLRRRPARRSTGYALESREARKPKRESAVITRWARERGGTARSARACSKITTSPCQGNAVNLIQNLTQPPAVALGDVQTKLAPWVGRARRAAFRAELRRSAGSPSCAVSQVRILTEFFLPAARFCRKRRAIRARDRFSFASSVSIRAWNFDGESRPDVGRGRVTRAAARSRLGVRRAVLRQSGPTPERSYARAVLRQSGPTATSSTGARAARARAFLVTLTQEPSLRRRWASSGRGEAVPNRTLSRRGASCDVGWAFTGGGGRGPKDASCRIRSLNRRSAIGFWR